jgi:hypothetical protein
MSRTSPFRRVVAVAGGIVALGSSASGRAEQFTFFNFEYEATTQNTQDAHYNARPPQHVFTQPDSWRAPIDYTQGTVYIEQDVLAKPSNLDTQVDICFISTGGYGCRSTEFYKTTGRVTTVRPANSFYQFNQINWNTKINLVQLIVKDRNNTNGGNPKSAFMPTRMRIAMTFVSKGDTYRPPPGFAAIAGDGGATTDAPAADAGGTDLPPDAAPPPPPPRTDAGPPPPAMVPPADPGTPAPAPRPSPPTGGNPQPMPASAPAPASGGFGCGLAAVPHGPSGHDLLALAMFLAGLACLRRRR